MGLSNVRVKLPRPVSFADALVLFALVAFVYGLIGVAEIWTSPFRPSTQIHLNLSSLVGYSLLSLVRVALAYVCSLAFTLAYGYVAAKSRRLEPLLISILDILQSVPVLGFMPGLVLTLVHLFPSSNIGLELAAILMIFSGQAWNMVFSFYSSLKAVPDEWKDMTSLLRLTPAQVLRSVELPFAANGLLWNSMLSVAGGWFFLMTIESFTLGDRNFRLPGIGSYMAVAHEQGKGLAQAIRERTKGMFAERLMHDVKKSPKVLRGDTYQRMMEFLKDNPPEAAPPTAAAPAPSSWRDAVVP